ncbi:MAG: hypothetical protein ACYTG6_00925 [Planctomycetota bacterium]
MLDREVFTQPEVGQALASFVSIQVDAENGEGESLAARYGISAFPTLLVVDADGDEIDRIIGFRPPEPFLEEIARIERDEGTLRALRRAFAENPDDLEAGTALARKLAGTYAEEAMALCRALEAKCDPGDTEGRASLLLIRGEVAMESRQYADALATFEEVMAMSPPPEVATSAAVGGATAAARLGEAVRGLALITEVRDTVTDPEQRATLASQAFRLHVAGANNALAQWAEAALELDDAEALNEAAWMAFTHKLAMRPALAWARRAVELSEEHPYMLDTLANLLYEAGQFEEAILIERKAVQKETDPEMRAEFMSILLRFRAVQALKGVGD